VIMIIVRLYQRDKYYQSDGYRNMTNQSLRPLRGLVPEVQTANKKHNFQRMATCVMGQVERKFTREFKGALVRTSQTLRRIVFFWALTHKCGLYLRTASELV
jgi:hypothetical protein